MSPPAAVTPHRAAAPTHAVPIPPTVATPSARKPPASNRDVHPAAATESKPATPSRAAGGSTSPTKHPSLARTSREAGAATKPSPAAVGQGGGAGTPAARGRDVANVHVVGLEFPFPGYLANLVRQVRLRFAPTDARAGLHADLAFVVARDGSISGLRVVRSSGSYAFDLEAQGAVEAAGSAGAFGPLPDAFAASALPVSFSFDPNTTP